MKPGDELGWWSISGRVLLDALRRCTAGEDADVVYAELYANTRVERPGSAADPRRLRDRTRVRHFLGDARERFTDDHVDAALSHTIQTSGRPLPAEAADLLARSDLSVDPDVIKEQRERGWPDFHPETHCHRCGGKNVRSWSVDSDRFNAAMQALGLDSLAIVCPGCFVLGHEMAAEMHCSWTLTPITPFRHNEDDHDF